MERADRGAGRPDLEVALAVGADRRNDLVADVVMELVLQPHLVLRRALALEQGAAGDAVARVDLDLAGLDQRGERADQVHALDLLGVAARGREHEHRLAEAAPAHQGGLAAEPLGPPAADRLDAVEVHGAAPAPGLWSSRQAPIRRQNSSVNSSTSWAGNSAATFFFTASRAAGVAKNSQATSSRCARCLAQNSSNPAASNRCSASRAYSRRRSRYGRSRLAIA